MIPRKRLLDRVCDPDVRFVYLVGQRGSGRTQLLLQLMERAATGSYGLLEDWDRLDADVRRSFIARLSRPPEGRRIVVTASDPSVEHPFADYPPYEQCIIEDADLAFDLDELRELVRGCSTTTEFPMFLLKTTGGYVAAVRSMCRILQNEGEAAARDLKSPKYLQLKRYIADVLLRSLSEEEYGVLLTTVAIGCGPGTTAVRTALPNANVERALTALQKRRLVYYDANYYVPFPLIEETIRHCVPTDVRRYAGSTILDLRANGECLAAARAALNVGSIETTIQCLADVPLAQLLSWDPKIDAMIAGLPDAVITADARLWIAAWRSRRTFIDSYVMEHEVETLIGVTHEKVEPIVEHVLRAILAYTYAQNGRVEEAGKLLESIPLTEAVPPNTLDVFLQAIRALTLLLQDELAEAEAVLRRISIAGGTSPMLVKLTNTVNCLRARREARWDVEKVFLQRQVDLAKTRRDDWMLAEALLEFAHAAALSADRGTLEGVREQLRVLTAAAEMGPYAGFAAVAGRAADVEMQRFGMPRLRAMQHFIEGFYAGSADEARIRIAAAVDEISKTRAVAVRAMYQIALSQLVSTRERELLDAASLVAEQLSWTALQASISHLRIGELPAPGQPMRALVQHFRSVRDVSNIRNLSLCIVTGTVSAGDAPINVSRKVFDLLVALAVRNRPVERDELCEMLWPDEEPQDAANALKMTVRRARLQCGDPNIIMWSGNRYAMGSHVLVDIRQMRAECERAFKDPSELSQNRHRLVEHYLKLATGCPTHLAEYEWFVGTNASLQNLQIELGSLLARDALDREDYEAVRALVPAMLECDPCDELAWEIVIRAHHAKGDAAAARRVVDEYIQVARRSGCRVAEHIRELAGREIA